MKFLITIFTICMSIAFVAGQLLFGQLPSRQLNLNSLEFGQSAPNTIRDPRQNRGPVVFPPSPPDAIEETSGVVVGASGYGFVPPQQSQSYFTSTNSLESPATSYSRFNFYNAYENPFSFF